MSPATKGRELVAPRLAEEPLRVLRIRIAKVEGLEPLRYVIEVPRGTVRMVGVVACGCGDLLPLLNTSVHGLGRLAKARGWTWSKHDLLWRCAACSPAREGSK